MMGGLVFTLITIQIIVVVVTNADPASDQLVKFRSNTRGPIGILTTENGAPVELEDTSSLSVPDIIQNEFLMDTISHQILEKIPERIAHPKGAGAFGYFEVTHNASDICRASVFESDGKITPVVVRFSPGNSDKGESDTRREARGFAVKFYTDEGNFDIAGFNTPFFISKDPQVFTFTTKAVRRNPVTNLRDRTMTWDYVSSKPEVVPFFLYLNGDNGIPDGYRNMPGFSIHTFQVYNTFGESYFVRFHFLPDGGIKNLFLEEAHQRGCSDPDYATRDLYNAIERGDYPSWTVSLQVLKLEDINKYKFDPFDITITLPEDIYPLRPLGKLVLNRNPTNFFADVEQAAFCPSNLVRGILGAPDNAFKLRRFAYKAGQRYRLGANFQKIEVNRPLSTVLTLNYERDGRAPVGRNGEGGPNYSPNTFNGPVPYVDKNKPKLIQLKQYPDSYNFEQATERYIKMSREERQRLVENIVDTLREAAKSVQGRVIEVFKYVHPELALATLAALTKASV